MTNPEVTNWGRWGEDDELGTLNLITPERILSAVRLVKKGRTYNLSVPLDKGGPQFPSFHKTWQVTYLTNRQSPGEYNVADDVVMMETHSGTHMDSLGHVWRDGKMWNGKSSTNVTSFGVNWAGIHNVSALVTRGVMLDMPRFKRVEHLKLGEIIRAQDMEACAKAQGVDIRPGDVLLVRTGWYKVFQDDLDLWSQGEPGPDASCTSWLKEKEIVAIGADNAAVEALVYRNVTSLSPRLHITALRDLGVYLLENLNLEQLARDEVYEFLFMAAPLCLTKATGAPVSPLAIV